MKHVTALATAAAIFIAAAFPAPAGAFSLDAVERAADTPAPAPYSMLSADAGSAGETLTIDEEIAKAEAEPPSPLRDLLVGGLLLVGLIALNAYAQRSLAAPAE